MVIGWTACDGAGKEALLAAKANPQLADSEGDTALSLACLPVRRGVAPTPGRAESRAYALHAHAAGSRVSAQGHAAVVTLLCTQCEPTAASWLLAQPGAGGRPPVHGARVGAQRWLGPHWHEGRGDMQAREARAHDDARRGAQQRGAAGRSTDKERHDRAAEEQREDQDA